MSDNDRHDTNRRTFLKTTGAAGLTLAAVGSASATSRRGSDARVVTADFSTGISTDRIEEIRRAAVEEFNDRGGDLEAAPARATPEVEDGTVVAYAYKISADGVPHQYTGIAGDAESASTLHGRARERADGFDATSDDVSIQSSSWDNILHDEADFCEDPYGCVTNNFDLFELKDDGDAYEDAYAMDHFFVMEPGKQKYSSNWVNDIGYPMHDWRQNSMGGETLDEWDPLGTHDGSQTINVTVGTGGADLGWSYTQPAVTTIDESSSSSDYAKWSEEFNTTDARENTNGMEPGSSCWLDEPADGSGYHDLLDLISEGQFYDSGWEDRYYTLKHTWHIDVYY